MEVPKGGTGAKKLLVGARETRSRRRRINLEGDETLTMVSLYVIEASLS